MIKAIIFDWVNTLYTYNEGLYPYSKKVLDYLKPKYRLGLVTLAAPGIEQRNMEIKESGLGNYFDAVVIEEQKSEKQYLKCLSLLGVVPAEAVVVDDQPYNISTAKKIGCQVYLVIKSETTEQLLELF